MPADTNSPFRRRQHASENGQQRGLAAPGRSHEQRQFTAFERQAYTLERRHLRSAAAKDLRHIHRIEQGRGHRENTMAGSMRVTCTIAAIADPMHITTVSRKSPIISPCVMTIGNAVAAVSFTMVSPISAAIEKPMMAFRSAWQTITA